MVTSNQNMETKRRVYKVAELTKNIRRVLEKDFSSLWVEGEISNFTLHSSGHMYFSLKDESSVMSAVMFRGSNKDLKFQVKDGMQVVCFGRIGVYEKRGQYQLYVDKMEPKGVGALQLAFEQLKAKLYKEGLFDKERKKPIPFLPTRIGVVTSPTGAAIRDILNVARRRFSNVEIILNPVKVQGTGAKEEIVKAIELFNTMGDIDVMIVGRGGGSIEDLWAFNEEVVARAISRSKIPIISAVGHEIDWTISDFVADMRVPTPSAAAERVFPRKEELMTRIGNALERLKNSLFNNVIQNQQRIDELLSNLRLRQEFIVKFKKQNLKTMFGKLEALSPLAVLKRGYSITETLDGKKVLKDIKDVNKGERIKTVLSKGQIISEVEDIG